MVPCLSRGNITQVLLVREKSKVLSGAKTFPKTRRKKSYEVGVSKWNHLGQGLSTPQIWRETDK